MLKSSRSLQLSKSYNAFYQCCWGLLLLTSLYNIVHSELKATFHLGNDKSWEGGGSSHRALALQNIENAYNLNIWPKICKFEANTNVARSPRTRYTAFIGNTESCTGLAYKFWCEDFDPCKVATCTNMTGDAPKQIVPCPGTTRVGQWYNMHSSKRKQ